MQRAQHPIYNFTLSTQIALLLIVSVFLWSVGAPILFQKVHAASSLTQVSDTLTSSNTLAPAGHTIKFTSNMPINPNQTIQIILDPVTNAFTEAYSLATSTDFTFYAGSTPYTVVSTCTSGNQVSAVGNYVAPNEGLTLTVCSGAAAISSSTPIVIGIATTTASTKVWTNPATTGSYRITVGGTQTNAGETRVMVLPNVILTALVNTSFTFVVTGLATTTGLNGQYATTTASSSPTSLPFATLASSTGPVTLAQQLNVTTNARNGFSVTVQENQPPTSSTGATIDLFANGATTTTPIPWTAPTAQLDVPSTYGHLGVTSDDADEGGGEFSSGQKWAGNIDQPRVIFSHTGPSDGTTQNKGKAIVAYRIQISDLQEAGNDYTNTLTYVATPTF